MTSLANTAGLTVESGNSNIACVLNSASSSGEGRKVLDG